MTERGSTPARTCVVCNGRKPKPSLLRMALDCESACIVMDLRQRLPGRGAYVCPGCLPELKFTKRVQRAFRNRARGLAAQPVEG